MLCRRAFIGALAGSVLLSARRVQADTPTWARDSKDPRWVQGQVSVTAAPDAVWERLQRVPDWPQIFTDIKTMRILERGPNAFRIRLETVTFDCGAHDYNVTLESLRTAKLGINAPGVTALAYMRVLDGAAEGSSRVIYSLFLEARGIAAWFHTEKELRAKQESMVVRYLADLDRTFRASSRASAGAGGG
jgi:hypothetical protein